MSSDPTMLINQAKQALADAKSFRQSAEDKKYAEKINIDNALEKSAAADNDTDKQYWKERAELLQQELNSEVQDLEGRANAKDQEAQKYKADAHAAAEQEKDDKKKELLWHALHVLNDE